MRLGSLSVRCVVAVLLFVAVAVWPGGTVAAADGAQAPAKGNPGSITGTVTDELLNPLVNQNVTLYRDTGSYLDYVGSDSSDSSGVYEFTGLDDGTYFVRAAYSQSDWVMELYDDIECMNYSCDEGEGTPVEVGFGAVTGIDFQLAEAGSISGTVLSSETGDQMWSARVTIYMPRENGELVEVGSDQNYDKGEPSYSYEVRGLGSGCYFAVGEPDSDYDPEYAPSAYPDVPVISAGEGPYDTNLDAPLVGDPISVEAGFETTGVDLTLHPGSTIVAQVTEAATRTAVPNARLELWGKSVTGEWVYVVGLEDRARDDSGIFIYQGLAAGEYAVMAGVNQWSGGPLKGVPPVAENANLVGEIWDNIPCPRSTCGPDDGTVLVVGESSLHLLEFELDEGGSISGTVTDEDMKALLNNIQIQVTAPGLSGWSGRFENSTWAWNGEYTVYGLPTGSYSVRAVGWDGPMQGGPAKGDPNEPEYETELYPGVTCEGLYCDTALGTPVAVTAGVDTLGIDFALALAGAIIGEVWPGGGKLVPLAGVTVRAWASGGEDAGMWDTTDYNGMYELPGLGAGSYFVTADTQGSSHDERIGELYNDDPCPAGNCDPTTGDAVVVSVNGETDGIEFDLSGGGVIEGRVTVEGAPAVGVRVTVVDGSGDVFGTVLSGCDGSYSIGGLTTGAYHAYTTNYRGDEDQNYDMLPCVGPCVPTAGDPISVTTGIPSSGIDFPLNVLFADGFESGDTSRWQ